MPLVHSDSVMWDSFSSHLHTPCVSTEGPREEHGEEFNRITRRHQPPCSMLPGLFLPESSQQPNELRCHPSPHFRDEGTGTEGHQQPRGQGERQGVGPGSQTLRPVLFSPPINAPQRMQSTGALDRVALSLSAMEKAANDNKENF